MGYEGQNLGLLQKRQVGAFLVAQSVWPPNLFWISFCVCYERMVQFSSFFLWLLSFFQVSYVEGFSFSIVCFWWRGRERVIAALIGSSRHSPSSYLANIFGTPMNARSWQYYKTQMSTWCHLLCYEVIIFSYNRYFSTMQYWVLLWS